MNKKEMIARMEAVVFRVQGIELQLVAGQMLRAAAATTEKDREKCLDAGIIMSKRVASLHSMVRIVESFHPEQFEMDELLDPFDMLENMTEEEIADWFMKECARRERRMQEKRDD